MTFRFVLVFASILALQACTTMRGGATSDVDYSPTMPLQDAHAPSANGTIFQANSSMNLFMDLRARAVGDIVTVLLVERTDASKESSTSTAKGTDIDTGIPIIAGRPVTRNGDAILNTAIQSDSSFTGQADATQSNSLDGSIAVTVAERLGNGNLLVRGEKWITLNQGEEFIRFSGIVRPVDIGPSNTVPSTKIANARISYSGKGNLANSNEAGWLSKFFNSPLFPF